MGKKQSKINTINTLDWNNINTNDMSSTRPGDYKMSSDALKLLSKLNNNNTNNSSNIFKKNIILVIIIILQLNIQKHPHLFHLICTKNICPNHLK